jgi:hypothetical protein
MRNFIFILIVILIIGHLLLFRLSSGNYGVIDVMGIIYPCTAELQNGYLNEAIIDTSKLKYAYISLLFHTNEYSGLTCGLYDLDYNESTIIKGFKVHLIDSLLYFDNKLLIKNDSVKISRQYSRFPEFWWNYKEDLILVNHGICRGYLMQNSTDRSDFKHPILFITGESYIVRCLNVQLIQVFKVTFIICCIIALYLILIFIRKNFNKIHF